jgi:predicted nucleic acid-binding protein
VICLDSSIVIKVIIEEQFSDKAMASVQAAVTRDELLVAPTLLSIEVTNVLRQRMRRSPVVTEDETLELLRRYESIHLEIHNPPGLHRQALLLATHYGLPATYDAHYLALASMLGCPFWTDDRKLLRMVGAADGYHWIGDYNVEQRESPRTAEENG